MVVKAQLSKEAKEARKLREVREIIAQIEKYGYVKYFRKY